MNIETFLTNTRYGLRDPSARTWADAELISYVNRALVQLDNALSALNSDWILKEEDVTLADGDKSIAVPLRCIVVREAYIGSETTPLVKTSPAWIYGERRNTSTSEGQPSYYAQAGSNLLFEMEADADYTVTVYFDQRATPVVAGADMPYGDEFNEPLRQMTELCAKHRNEYDVGLDAQMYNFFFSFCVANVMRRKLVTKKTSLGF
jgi:hypothetical protein